MNPQNIIDILHSIKKITIDECHQMVVKFNDSHEEFTSSEFVPETFTKELLNLIERHLSSAQR